MVTVQTLDTTMQDTGIICPPHFMFKRFGETQIGLETYPPPVWYEREDQALVVLLFLLDLLLIGRGLIWGTTDPTTNQASVDYVNDVITVRRLHYFFLFFNFLTV